MVKIAFNPGEIIIHGEIIIQVHLIKLLGYKNYKKGELIPYSLKTIKRVIGKPIEST